jgi:hypothetical protein
MQVRDLTPDLARLTYALPGAGYAHMSSGYENPLQGAMSLCRAYIAPPDRLSPAPGDTVCPVCLEEVRRVSGGPLPAQGQKTILDMVLDVARLPGVGALTFRRYRIAPPVIERLAATDGDRAAVLVAVGADDREIHTFSAKDLGVSGMQKMVGPDEALAIASSVEMTSGIERHFLILDFAVPVSEAATASLNACLTATGWHGWLLISGSSYHFIGRDLMTAREWRSAMGRALLIPGIDIRYMGHRLTAGLGAARITVHPRKPTLPYVIAEINASNS